MCGYHVCCHVLLLFFITFSSSVSFMHSQASLLFLPLCPVLHLLLLLLLCPVLLCSRAAPSPSSSLHSLTCLGTAVTKSLRKRRILHRFSLGPGTPLQRVCVCVCVFLCECVSVRTRPSLLVCTAGSRLTVVYKHCSAEGLQRKAGYP